MRKLMMGLGLCGWLAGCGVWKPAEDESISYMLDASVPRRATGSGGPAVAVARPALPSYLGLGALRCWNDRTASFPSSKVLVPVEFSEHVVVVLDGCFVRRLNVPERRLPPRVADCAVASKAFLEHSQQHRNFAVDVIEDADVTLAGVEAMQAPGVLDEGPLPRDRQRQEERVKPRIVEPLSAIQRRIANERHGE